MYVSAGVRNLPKIEKKSSSKGKSSKKGKESDEVKNDIKPAPLGPLGSRKASAQSNATNNDQPSSGLESLAEAAKEE